MSYSDIPSTELALDADTLSKLIRLAAMRESTVHGLLQEAVRSYLDSAAAREQLLRESVDAWADFPQHSERKSVEERNAWVAMLEAGAAPERH